MKYLAILLLLVAIVGTLMVEADPVPHRGWGGYGGGYGGYGGYGGGYRGGYSGGFGGYGGFGGREGSRWGR